MATPKTRLRALPTATTAEDVSLREYVEAMAKQEGISTQASTREIIEELHTALRAAKASAEEAEKDIETLKAANEEARADAVDLLKELGFDVMPLLSAGAFQDPPSFADPLVVSAMCRQA